MEECHRVGGGKNGNKNRIFSTDTSYATYKTKKDTKKKKKMDVTNVLSRIVKKILDVGKCKRLCGRRTRPPWVIGTKKEKKKSGDCGNTTEGNYTYFNKLYQNNKFKKAPRCDLM